MRERQRDREGQSICLRISVIKFLFILYLLSSKKIKLLQFDCFFYSCCLEFFEICILEMIQSCNGGYAREDMSFHAPSIRNNNNVVL